MPPSLRNAAQEAPDVHRRQHHGPGLVVAAEVAHRALEPVEQTPRLESASSARKLPTEEWRIAPRISSSTSLSMT